MHIYLLLTSLQLQERYLQLLSTFTLMDDAYQWSVVCRLSSVSTMLKQSFQFDAFLGWENDICLGYLDHQTHTW